MPKRKAVVIGLPGLLLVTALGMGLWQLRAQTNDRGSVYAYGSSKVELGVVYVPVTANSAPYYGLAIDHGALITAVAPGSPADRAGLQPGEVILSFNGIMVQGDVSLARLLIDCTSGHGDSPHQVTIEAWVDGCVHLLYVTHGNKTVY